MDLAADLVIPKMRCAPLHESMSVDPVGSAGAYDAFVCVEVPLPWERDVSMMDPFRSVVASVGASTTGPDGRTWRPQAIVPVGGPGGASSTPGAPVRVTAYEQPSATRAGHERLSSAGAFVRREWVVAPERAADLAIALVQVDEATIAEFAHDSVAVDPSVLDVFICTHGRRDTCCGQLGTDLFTSVASAFAGADHVGPGGVRVRRTSHTGGHRFAPTALTFPDGYAWAHLDGDAVHDLIVRGGPADALAPHCRGVSSLSGGPAQAADRAALGQVGWRWTRASRTVTVLAFDRLTMATTVRVDGLVPVDGVAVEGPGSHEPRSFEIEIALDRHVPQTTCGAIDGPEYKVEPVWRIDAVRVC